MHKRSNKFRNWTLGAILLQSNCKIDCINVLIILNALNLNELTT